LNHASIADVAASWGELAKLPLAAGWPLPGSLHAPIQPDCALHASVTVSISDPYLRGLAAVANREQLAEGVNVNAPAALEARRACGGRLDAERAALRIDQLTLA